MQSRGPENGTEAQRQAVESVSAEGRPADPRFGGCGTAIVFVAVALLILVAGIVIAIAFNVAAGVATAVVGAVLLAVNPVLWASVGRAKERAEVRHDVEDR